jgi:hypothetical protein
MDKEQPRVLVQVRLPRDLVRLIDHLAVDHECYRVQMVERLLQEAINLHPEAERWKQ